MNVTRVLRTAAATLSHTFYVGETTVDSDGDVQVSVVDANGAAVTSGTATSAGSGRYTFALPAQSQLALLAVSWTATIGGAQVVETDHVEVVGGFYWSLVEARASEEEFADTSKYPAEDMETFRFEVEAECERITQRAWVPRYRRVVLDGTGTTDLLLPDGADELAGGVTLRGVRTVRSVRVAPRPGAAFAELTAGELAACVVTPDGMLRRVDGRAWAEGVANVIVEYEYGSDAPPPDLRRATLLRLRSRANMHRSGVPDRAISFTVAEGGTYRLSTPSAERTGIPEVDGVYQRYSRGGGSGSGAGSPASRPLNFDPQWHGLFHGGVR